MIAPQTAGLRVDVDELRAFLGAVCRGRQVYELRLPKARRGPLGWRAGVTYSGYFDSSHALVAAVECVTGRDAPGVYLTLNPVQPALLARRANRLAPLGKDDESTKDRDVVRRATLLVDIDAVRPSGISATDAEVGAALSVRDQVEAYLTDHGWPPPLVRGMSGNGAHLVYAVHLPNDIESTTLIRGVLTTLAALFNTNAATVDESVFNPSRLTKMMGTIVAKGDPTADRPWRLARAEYTPDAPIVERALLEALDAQAPAPLPARMRERSREPEGDCSTAALLRGAGIGYTERTTGYATVYALDRCLTSDEHTSGAAVLQFPSGALAYRCLHNSCAGKTWRDVRPVLGLTDRSPDGIRDDFRDAHGGAQGGCFASSANTATIPADWEAPVALGRGHGEPFPTTTLPDWLRAWVEGEAIATQTPTALPAMMALAVLATACARWVEVRVRPGWGEPLSVFTVTTLGPANRKSAVVRDATAPLEAFERELEQRMRPAIAEAQARYRMLESRLQKAQRAAAAEDDGTRRAALEAEAVELAQELAAHPVPELPRLIVDDCTPERLATLLRDHGGRMAVLSAEGGVFDILAGRYSASGAANFEVFLKGHAGDTLRVDRVGRPAEFVERPALTVGLTVQPAVLGGLLERAHFRGRGLLGRFLYAMPESLIGRRNTNAPPLPRSIQQEYHTRVQTLLMLGQGQIEANTATCALTFSTGALAEFDAFHAALEPRLGDAGDLVNLTDWGGKLAGAVARLAGLLHLAAHAGSATPWDIPIGSATMTAAIALGEWLIDHAKVAFAEMGADPALADARFVLRWVEQRGHTAYTKRNIFEGTKGRFKTVEALEPALDLLEERGYLRRRPRPETPGRVGRYPSPVYDVHPAVHSQNAHNSQNGSLLPNSANLANSANASTARTDGDLTPAEPTGPMATTSQERSTHEVAEPDLWVVEVADDSVDQQLDDALGELWAAAAATSPPEDGTSMVPLGVGGEQDAAPDDDWERF